MHAEIDINEDIDMQRLAVEVERLTRQVRVLKRTVFRGLFDSKRDMLEYLTDLW